MELNTASVSHPLLHINPRLLLALHYLYTAPQGPFLAWFQGTTTLSKCLIVIKRHLVNCPIRGARHPVVTLCRDCALQKMQPAQDVVQERGFATFSYPKLPQGSLDKL